MAALSEKTILVTGGSRGIGQAIVEKCLAEGANIIIIAKDNDNEKIIKADKRCMIYDIDVKDEAAVTQAIENAMARFNKIDALINNVSTFCFDDTEQISMSNFDELFSVNVRATFLLSKLCIPHLKHAANPHIINIAPPLLMDAKWFEHHGAFSMSKYGMSMCTLGMAQEFKKDGIAVNSLWPRTTIATSTIQSHFKPEVYAGSRIPMIMADAAVELMKMKAKKTTGNFFIDEDLLRQTGVTDFSRYAVDPNASLVEDLFVLDNTKLQANNTKKLEQDLFLKSH